MSRSLPGSGQAITILPQTKEINMKKQPKSLTIREQMILAKLQKQLASGAMTFLEYHLALYAIYQPDLPSW